MKKLFSFAICIVAGLASVSAQYFCTEEGKVMYYKSADMEGKEPVESVTKAKTLKVEKNAEGGITARLENTEPVPDNPLADITTFVNQSYDPATDITTIVLVSADDLKELILTTIKESAHAAGHHFSDMELADIEKAMSTKGQIELIIDPKAEIDAKLPNSSLRLNAGIMNMSMKLWEGKFLGTESVTTEAGTFDCVKVCYVLRSDTPGGNKKQNITEWYAKNVGLVKHIETDKKGKITTEQTLRVIK